MITDKELDPYNRLLLLYVYRNFINYLFDSGSGTIISDVSGFGSPLDLTIEGTNFSWRTDNLEKCTYRNCSLF